MGKEIMDFGFAPELLMNQEERKKYAETTSFPFWPYILAVIFGIVAIIIA